MSIREFGILRIKSPTHVHEYCGINIHKNVVFNGIYVEGLVLRHIVLSTKEQENGLDDSSV